MANKVILQLERNNRIFKYPCVLNLTDTRIEFIRSSFDLKDEIKAMRGSKWHGFDPQPRKIWSVENHARNHFQLRLLMGENPYEWFEQDLIDIDDFKRPVREHQVDMIRRGLTYHYQILAAEQRLGKSLAFFEIMERSGKKNWWYVSQASAIASVEMEVKKWKLDPSIKLEIMSYEKLVSKMRFDFQGMKAPDGIGFDETDLLKNPTANRTIAAQGIADLIREQHGMEGYVLALSGTPSAKNPSDLWAQAEIVWPGYLREGSLHAFEKRYAIMSEGKDAEGMTFLKREGWNEEEVTALPHRLDGLMTVYRKADCLNLLPMESDTIYLEPSNKVKRVAGSLCRIAPNTITALTWTRALSSGFQYVMKQSGEKTCPVCAGVGTYNTPEPGPCPGCNGEKVVPDFERETIKVECPKDDALREILQRKADDKRLVVAACFQGSIDRVVALCHAEGWDTCIVDGRGWTVVGADGHTIPDAKVLEYWEYSENKVCFVANPGTARYGLALFKSDTLVWYDLDFSAVHYLQMNARVEQVQALDEPKQATIVHLMHLPVDKLVLDTLQQNRKLELLSLGALNEIMDCDDSDGCAETEILEAVA